jgi:ABC-2 type transport system ATP-binding protein
VTAAPAAERPRADLAPAVRLEGLTKRYRGGRGGGVLAVADLSLEVRHGAVFGLLGPNGAGKTTALRMLVGLVRPSAGRAFLFGEPVVPGAPVLSRVGVLVENPGFVPHLSGAANLAAYWRAGGAPMSRANLDRALGVAALGPAIDRKVKTYSLGMKQRLALAQALLGEPELVILDEPTNGLDPAQMREVREAIRRLAGHGVTVLLSSHLLAEVEQICTTAAVMDRGRLVFAGTVTELVGRSTGVRLEVDDPAAARRVLTGSPGVREVTEDAAGLMVTVDGASNPQLVRRLVEAGVGVVQVVNQRRLEDAFIELLAGGET